MNRRTIQTDGAPKPIGPYSQAVAAGGFLYCSGQIPLDPASGDMVTGDMGVQTRRVLDNLKAVLASAGAALSDSVKLTVYLADMADFQAVNRVFEEYFPQDPPARAVVQAGALPKGARLELDCIAWLPEKGKS